MAELKDFFGKQLKVINMGLEAFGDDLKSQQVETLQMDWRPPAGGNPKLASLLDKLK